MDAIEIRRKLISGRKVRLPSEYQEVTWIRGLECDIDLGYIPTVSPKAIITMEILATVDKDIMGFPINQHPSFIIDSTLGNPTRWYNRYGSTNAYSLSPAPVYATKQQWEFGRVVKLNGDICTELEEADWSTNRQSFHLFAARTKHLNLKVYDFTLYDGDTCVREMIPCYRKFDEVIGMYDIISNTFFTSTLGSLYKGARV